MSSSREERAAARRAAAIPGQIVQLGERKSRLYAGLSYEERIARFWQLNLRAWVAAGHAIPEVLARADLPGEVFQIGVDD